ncbi:acyltransferase family protein [Bisbaumannia pacifica]|uniref:Acyltransferase n=1 Tax=Bisbaumannia pacifica TaxID=77098 RepID=A0ABD4L5H3_9GAMM|nr:acyltransferase [Halomonas pacifica]MBH8581161.1 acyltransferase [Halomonas pacifica]
MRSSNIAYLPRLDHLRFLAAGLVLAFHLYHYFFHGWRPNPESALIGFIIEGHSGVALFFTLSGFLFMLIAMQGPIAYGRFLYNRILRIAPLFLVVFYLAITLGRDGFEAADLFYVMFSNIGSPPTSDYFVTGAAWTISVEFTFYLIFPFLAAFFLAQGWRYLLGLLALLMLFKLVIFTQVDDPIHVFYSTLPGRLDQFLVGMGAARLYHDHREAMARRAWPLMISGALAVYGLLFLLARHASWMSENRHEPLWVVWSGLEAFGWAWLILGYLALPPRRGRLAAAMARFAEFGGNTSYSLYLLHASVLLLMREWLGVLQPTPWFMVNFAINLILALVLCLAVASLSHAVIEKPFLGLRRRYVASDGAATGAHAGSATRA